MKHLNFTLFLLAFLFVQSQIFSQWEGYPDIYYNQGNVGIGTTYPGAKLHISNGGLRLSYDSDFLQKIWEVNYDPSGYFYIDEFGLARHFTIKNGGNVGIGTTDPLYKLDVAGNMRINSTLNISDGTMPTNTQQYIKTSYLYPMRIDNTGFAYNRFLLTDLSGGVNILETQSGPNGYFDFRGNSTSNTILRIANNGYVGIGTNNPQAKLHLKNSTGWENTIRFEDDHSSSRIQVFSGNGGLMNFYTDNNEIVKFAIKNDGSISWNDDQSYLSANEGGSIELNASNTAGRKPFIDFHRGFSEQDWNYRIINEEDNQLSFRNSSNNPTICLKNDIVGIGTDNPDGNFRLSVDGKIKAKGIKVQANWSDFVFKPGYNLRTVKEVESFIKENGHLPEIPSEQEVTENGVELGEISSKLLQKIEELTLYIIEQDKRLENLEKENENLKTANSK